MTGADNHFLDQIDRLIDARADAPLLSGETICEHFGVSRSHLHRTLRKQTGLSPTLYIRKRRLLLARHLLETTDLRVGEIGDRVGIGSPQNFSKYFTAQFGVSPSSLRRRQAGQPGQLQPDADSTAFRSVNGPAPNGVADEVDRAGMHPAPITDTGPLASPTRPGLPNAPWPKRLAFGLLTGLGVWALFWLVSYRYAPNGPPAVVQRSIAVLPFKNSGAADTSPLVEGITDDLHTVLSLADSLKVIAQTSSGQYAHTKKTVWQIGDDLQVANLLRGSVLKTGDRLQIRLELIRTQDDIRLWTKTYSGAYPDLFRLTDQMGQDVLQQLNPPTAGPRQPTARPAPTTSMVAYNAFLQGRQLMLTRSEEKIEAGIARFDEAIRLDGHFADAYAYKAVSCHLLLDMGYLTGTATWEQGKQNALAAIRIDSTNSTAYAR